jgi:DNA-binding HxlR family transcriptional regulator
MNWKNLSESFCDIALALSVVGDRWTLLIIRELSLGFRRFEEIQAQTGMSSLLLASRLKRLESDGVIERRLYSERPKRYEYYATPKGNDLDPVLLALRAWSLKWEKCGPKKGPAVKLIYKKTGEEIDQSWTIPKGKPFSFADTQGTMSREWKAEREARQIAFHQARKQKTNTGSKKKASHESRGSHGGVKS